MPGDGCEAPFMKKISLFLISIAFSTATAAQPYPSKPVRLLVGFGAGGPTDVIARFIAQDMTASMGQSVIVENRPGANAIIATEAVARSAPDGYTLLFSSLSLLVNPLLPGTKAAYDPFKDSVHRRRGPRACSGQGRLHPHHQGSQVPPRGTPGARRQEDQAGGEKPRSDGGGV